MSKLKQFLLLLLGTMAGGMALHANVNAYTLDTQTYPLGVATKFNYFAAGGIKVGSNTKKINARLAGSTIDFSNASNFTSNNMSSSSSDYGFEDHTTLTNPAAVFGVFTNDANGNALAAFENGFNIKNKSSSKFVTFKKPSSWGSTVYAYVYNKSTSTVVTSAWPGTQMNESNDGTYTLSFSSSEDDSNLKIIFDDGDHQYPAVNSGGWDFSSDAVYDENGKTSDTNTSLNKFIIADSSTVPSDISSLSSFLSNKLSDDASFSGNETTSFSQAASQLETLSNFYNSETDSSNTYRVLSSSGEDVTSNSTISSSYSSSDNYTEIFDITSLASSAAVVFLQPTDNGTNEITKLKVEVPSDSSSKIYIVINWPQDNYNFDSGSLTIDNSFPANRVINNFYNLTSDLSSPDITSNAISIDSGHGINFGTILAPHNNVKLDSDTSADVNVATGGILTLNCDTLNPSNQFAITNFPKLDVIPTINSVEFEGNDTTSSDRTVSTSGSSATLTGATYGENIFADITTAGSTSDYTLYEKLNDGNWTAVNDDPSKVKLSSQDDFNKNIFTFNSGTDTSTNSKIIGGTLQRSNTVKFEWAKNIPTDDTNAFTATVTEENDLSATVPTTIDFGSIALGVTSWSSISNSISSSISIKNGWDFPIGIAILNVTAGSSLTNEGTTSTIDITDIAKALQMSSSDSTSSSWDNTASSYSYDISDISSSIDFPLRIALGNLSSASLKEVSVGTTYEIPLTWTITVNPLSSSSS